MQNTWGEESPTFEESTPVDISHRTFTTTLVLKPRDVHKMYRRCVINDEIETKDLVVMYNSIVTKLLRVDDLSDDDFISMFEKIKGRANIVYNRKIKELKSRG